MALKLYFLSLIFCVLGACSALNSVNGAALVGEGAGLAACQEKGQAVQAACDGGCADAAYQAYLYCTEEGGLGNER